MEESIQLIAVNLGKIAKELIKDSKEPGTISIWLTSTIALAAIISTILTSRYQMSVSRDLKTSELRANIVTTARKEWADQLRHTIGVILAQSNLILNAHRFKDKDQLGKCISTLQQEMGKLQLLMDPQKAKHSELIAQIFSYYVKTVEINNKRGNSDIINLSTNQEKYRNDKITREENYESIIEISQILLEDNWEKIQEIR